MSKHSTYQPPHTIPPEILNRVAWFSETIGRLTLLSDKTDCAPFIAFMRHMLAKALASTSPQAAPQGSPQVSALPRALQGEMPR